MQRRKETGQVLVEYAIMLVICVLIAAAMLGLFDGLSTYGSHLIRLVGINAP